MIHESHKDVLAGARGFVSVVAGVKKHLLGDDILTANEVEGAIKYFFQPLRDQLKSASEELQNKAVADWSFLSFEDVQPFDRRGFCDPALTWFYTFRDSQDRVGMLTTTISTGILHPNVFGHFNISSALLDRVRSIDTFAAANIVRGESDIDFLKGGEGKQ